MEPEPPCAPQEATDESLRTEREEADRAVVESRVESEERADAVLGKTRQHADEVLQAARSEVDDLLDSAGAGLWQRVTLAHGRGLEDEALQVERTESDARVEAQRQQEARTLARLWPREREATDRCLLTERARADEQIAHRDDFMEMVSHDLRNLLCGVAWEAERLALAAADSDDGRRTVAAMKRLELYVARMNSLVRDLVDVAGIEAGKLTMRPERCDAVALLEEACESFQPAAREKGIVLDCRVAERSLVANLDPKRILQVLANLVSNALKFTPRGGRVVILGERIEDEARLSVSDTGMGIPPSMLEAVFERFWQVGKDDQRGFGLGLFISRRIVEAHGGRIWAKSAVGNGSSFLFTTPLLAS